MQLKFFVISLFQVVAAMALEQRDTGAVLTAERIYHTVIDQSPFLVQSTSTVTWTQSASVVVDQPTTAPTPTVAY